MPEKELRTTAIVKDAAGGGLLGGFLSLELATEFWILDSFSRNTRNVEWAIIKGCTLAGVAVGALIGATRPLHAEKGWLDRFSTPLHSSTHLTPPGR